MFVQDTESASTCAAGTDEFFQPGLVMDYFDRQHRHRAGLERRAELAQSANNNYNTNLGRPRRAR